ncbi:glycosyltransferase [Streptomyces acidiscabies]|uniref:Glycosyltransferase family 4 protein n=1 Tax=Streptomyces acidiscabies TaxID=42234 RepID=A0AAP6EKS4_9ACTN|nr:glycosyltransferase [Streptomyces acidiscabies]MBP5937921.1 glycosyltransferase family 4 protein [Streptomyces sp. LBUM 1476]MBZ3908922.1 glycosyltransferase family 4 protein [Streptomyces acidiscabies]MDX2966572.1 glycosyltransferase family 4 protein [Streptomyces acidiscabies]MDX3016671.1 glycosyltransferase family 4 protein [Streptomyces acidiscabies]MDX3788421.1 glycosyltransferase family 4 protein [Streptomyces acidiscabies]
MKRVVYSMEPVGRTGGRVYLRMLHEATAGDVEWRTVPDHKRTYRVRRWRKLRHLARLAPTIRKLESTRGTFVWDDLSLLLFTPDMRARTVFLLHHYEPLQHDSAPVEAMLWERLFQVLPQCAAVVCVAPFWADFLRARGVRDVQVIYNAFDMAEIGQARGFDRDECRTEFGLPPDVIGVYVGKAVHWKGTDEVSAALAGVPGLRVITSGSNTIGFDGTHFDVARERYLRLLCACDVGVFLPRMQEGWSRCAAEALLMGLPCLIRPVAGLSDLATLTGQPAPDLDRLPTQVRERATARQSETKAAYEALARFDLAYFGNAWGDLLAKIA